MKYFFQKDPITKQHIIIKDLNLINPSKEGESLIIDLKCIKNTGYENSRFSPVSNIYFINKRDPKKIEDALKTYLKKKNTKKNL